MTTLANNVSNNTSSGSLVRQTTKKRIVQMANELLAMCNLNASNKFKSSKLSDFYQSIPDKITSVKQVNGNLFVLFYEELCNTELVDKKWPIKSIEDEIHNIQAVIDSISMDLLHEDLSHLTGESMVFYSDADKNGTKRKKRADLVSIEYLLDIIRSLNEWISSRLESNHEDNNVTNKSIQTPVLSQQNRQQNELPILSLPLTDMQQTSETTIHKTSNLMDKPQYSTNQSLDFNEKLNKPKEISNDQNQIFKDYMSQKEQEYKLNTSNISNKNNQKTQTPFTSNQMKILIDDNNNNDNNKYLSNESAHLFPKKFSNSYDTMQTKSQKQPNLFDTKLSSSSGNSSLNSFSSSASSSRSSSSCRSYDASSANKNNEYKRNINRNIHRIQPQPISSSSSRQVRFDLDDPSYASKLYGRPKTRSASLTNNTISRRSLDPLIQTVGNEINQIKQSLDAAKSKENEKIQHLLKSIYDEDLKDAHLIMNKLTSKLKHKSDVTNDLFLTAYNQHNNHLKRDDVAPSFALKYNNLKPTSSSKSKSVLIPQCKSLHSLKTFEKSKTLSRDNSLKTGTRLRSASLLDINRQDAQNDDDLVYILNNFKSSSYNQLNSGSTSSLNCNPASKLKLASSNKSLSARNHTEYNKVSKEFMSRFTIGEDGILASLLQEFPYLYTSPETIHYLWQKHARQIQTLSKTQKEIDITTRSNIEDIGTTTKVQAHLKEAYRKQEMLMDLMRKELTHMQRMQELKRKQQVDNAMKAKAREQRCQSAKIKRYYEDFRLKQRARLIKQAHSEEQIFKQMFNESLKLQKERMLELKRYTKEKNELNSKQQLDKIESIENFYKNKFNLLNEKMIKDKNDILVREKAQHLILNNMKVQVKSKLESDIVDLQEQMCRDKDFLYWRQMDANRIKGELNKASYFKQQQQIKQ